MSPFEIDDATVYRVAVARPVRLDTTKLLPRDAHKVRGDALRAIVDEYGWEAVDGATPIT